MSTLVNRKYHYDMATPWTVREGETPWNVYPRPQMKRDSFLCLNGKWKIACETKHKTEDWGEILVPFPPESALSGIGRTPDEDDVLVYTRTFTLPDGFRKDRVLLHFGAVDQFAEVLLNGTPVGSHKGGYLPFTIDVTDALRPAENELTVKVRDPLSTLYPFGKQRKKRGMIWYTPISGIWQTVWIESVPAVAISKLKLTPWYDKVTIEIEGEGTEAPEKILRIETEYGTDEIRFTGASYVYMPKFPHTWSPEDPYLYEFTLELPGSGDTVASYFALRSVALGTADAGLHANIPRIYFNGAPYFFHGVLDQGYYSDGIYLPASPEGYADDIRRMKELGFNTLRKHIKIEPEVFYYECDRQGMIVFQDLVNSGTYEPIRDTVFPMLGLRKSEPQKPEEERHEIFEEAMAGTLSHLYNHPSIFYYTIFNEGWGQMDTAYFYRRAKELDPTRVIDSASGYFDVSESDVKSLHKYGGGVTAWIEEQRCERAMILSEFGGVAQREDGHIFNSSHAFGYQKAGDSRDLTAQIEKLYREDIIPQIRKGLCGAIYTQLSDVEDELNGLLTYDRQIMKVDPAVMREIAEDISAIMHLRVSDTESAKEMVTEPGGNLLLGDSITDMYKTEEWLKDYRVYNRGFSGDRSDQMLSKLPTTLGVLHPDVIVVLIGSNDVGHGFSPDDLAKNLRRTNEMIRERTPNAKVYLLTPLPSNPDAKLDHPKHEMFTSVRPNDKLCEMRARQKELAAELGWEYRDFASALMDEKGRLREECTVEGLHLNENGYAIYTEMIRPLLKK